MWKEKERKRERGREGRKRESMRDREPGSSGAQQRGLCASARPSRAQRRVEDEGGERRQGGGGGPTGKGPGLGPVAGAYIPQNRLHIDLGLGSHEETPSTPPPSNPFLLHSPPPQLSRGQL